MVNLVSDDLSRAAGEGLAHKNDPRKFEGVRGDIIIEGLCEFPRIIFEKRP